MGAIAIAAAVTQGCVNTKFQSNAPDHGLVVADEPLAAAIGREVLMEGGTAGDAAAAMALAMTVTLPSRVGFGGGGVCVVHDSRTKEVRTIDFRPGPAGGGGATPAFLRGIYALHAQTGTLRWEQVAVRAEALARAATPVSRALAEDLRAATGGLDGPARALFAPSGRPLSEGAPLARPDLATTLSRARREGITPFYMGTGAESFAAALGVDAGAVRGARPLWGDTATVPLGGGVALHFADPQPGDTGARRAAAFRAGADAPRDQRGARAVQSLGAEGEAPPAAGFAVIDGSEGAAACTFTLGGLFGTGRLDPATGVVTGRPAGSAGFGAQALATSRLGRTLFAAAAGANGGGSGGGATLLETAVPVITDQRRPSEVLAERPAAATAGRVAMVGCTVSMDSGLKQCQPAADPRGHGIAFDVELPRED
ncbi:gamma-glutamyltransferase [Azospirillum halopraeferens]|uniref:gamma-glutamyltransferase n=1 Tax=Azospirillum halopraeferens TaxID=34010 RepID=UPI0004270258|nr:gamma-glutamyltransferase [Azospirillum halopraeferens]